MARKVFLSFHYKPDNWRVSQIKSIGKIEGAPLLSSNGWEEVKKGGDTAVEKWISDNMKGRSCLIVLIGEKTANRKWINYEIKKAWREGKGVLGIYIHKLQDKDKNQANKGKNPFDAFKVGDKSMSTIVKSYDSSYSSSQYVYGDIQENIDDWIEEAITIRKKY